MVSTHSSVEGAERGEAMGHSTGLRNADGSWRYTNALNHESSPYLLQHAHNPVDWHPWGPAAFDLARQTGKPIFLSVGYSTCYWCHVMERQVFENPQIAVMLNKHFINVKVDREERPDVDDIYMTAVQMMTQHGGWPMSVFLTPPGANGPDDPGLKPFWAATYIPPEPSHGMPGMPQVIQSLTNAWKNDRKQVITQADHIARVVTEHLSRKRTGGTVPTPSLIEVAAGQILGSYDRQDGGFGGPPKFPQPTYLLFLMRVYQNNPDPEVWQPLAHTLDRMAHGGMYDQVGGGFHRYSTDGQWLVPHFEKMLYDNAQLVETYVTAQQLQPPLPPTETDLYNRIIRETCDYVLREMTGQVKPFEPEQDEQGPALPGGVIFYSAQDAEVDAREGLNYLWTPQQVRDAIDDTVLGDLAVKMYGLDHGTNFQDPHHPDEPRSNVLYLPSGLSELAGDEDQTVEQITSFRDTINEQLYKARMRRWQPSKDDKAILSWNGMMVAAMAKAGALLGEARYTDTAADVAQTVMTRMASPNGGLYRTMRQGQAKIPAFLEDYAFFIHGLIELHRVTGDARWLKEARRLNDYTHEHFSARDQLGGGHYDTLADQGDLFVRTVSVYDGAMPSGNSQMVHNLLDLYESAQEESHLDVAVRDLMTFSGDLERFGQGMSHMHHALLRAMEIDPTRFVEPGHDGEVSQAAAHDPTRGMADTPGQDDETIDKNVEASSLRRRVVAVDVTPKVIDLSSDEPVQVRVTLDIGPDYHLNTHNPGVAGLIPTTLELHDATGLILAVKYPKGQERNYPFADRPLRVYDGRTEITATISRSDIPADSGPLERESPTTNPQHTAKNHVEDNAKAHSSGKSGGESPMFHAAQLVLRYQVCTDNSCLEPTQAVLPVRFTDGLEAGDLD